MKISLDWEAIVEDDLLYYDIASSPMPYKRTWYKAVRGNTEFRVKPAMIPQGTWFWTATNRKEGWSINNLELVGYQFGDYIIAIKNCELTVTMYELLRSLPEPRGE